MQTSAMPRPLPDWAKASVTPKADEGGWSERCCPRYELAATHTNDAGLTCGRVKVLHGRVAPDDEGQLLPVLAVVGGKVGNVLLVCLPGTAALSGGLPDGHAC